MLKPYHPLYSHCLWITGEAAPDAGRSFGSSRVWQDFILTVLSVLVGFYSNIFSCYGPSI